MVTCSVRSLYMDCVLARKEKSFNLDAYIHIHLLLLEMIVYQKVISNWEMLSQ